VRSAGFVVPPINIYGVFHWSQDSKIALQPPGIVVMYVAFNHLHKRIFVRCLLPYCSLQNSPKSFHGAFVNALAYPGVNAGL
jgi:hypothetical protein